MDNISLVLIKEIIQELKLYSNVEYSFREKTTFKGDFEIELEQAVFKENTAIFMVRYLVKNKSEVEKIRLVTSERLLKEILMSGITNTKENEHGYC